MLFVAPLLTATEATNVVLEALTIKRPVLLMVTLHRHPKLLQQQRSTIATIDINAHQIDHRQPNC